MQHPDEGIIHAWLDGELDAAESARIEALVARDPEWAAAAAEARGLIAASSRIVHALDRVPANVVPGRLRAPKRPWWIARAAALLVLVAGTAVVWRRGTEQVVVQPHVLPSPSAGMVAAQRARPPVAESTPHASSKEPTALTDHAEPRQAQPAAPTPAPALQAAPPARRHAPSPSTISIDIAIDAGDIRGGLFEQARRTGELLSGRRIVDHGRGERIRCRSCRGARKSRGRRIASRTGHSAAGGTDSDTRRYRAPEWHRHRSGDMA